MSDPMKRSPLKHTRLNPGATRLRRTQLNSRGARAKREEKALAENRELALKRDKRTCVVCGWAPLWFEGMPTTHLHVHHIASRARCGGDKRTHHLGNLATVCYGCHNHIHRHPNHPLIKTRAFLDSLA